MERYSLFNKNEPLFEYQLLKFDVESDYEILIITSRMAIKSLIQNNAIEKNISIILVGQKSAKLLKENDFHNIKYVAENVEELMNFIEVNGLFHNKMCYLRGNYITYDICKKYKNIDEKIIYNIDYKDDLTDEFKNNLKDGKIEKCMFFSFKSMEEFIKVCESQNLLQFLKNVDAFSMNKNSKSEFNEKIFRSVEIFN